MSIDRSQSQQLFESIFTIGTNRPFQQIRKDLYENTALTQQQAQQLHIILRHEVIELYYKALISFAEAYVRVQHKSYSWPTIELYYSVFYASKAFLCAYDFAILRAERRLFYVRALPNEKFSRCTNTTDHKATFEVMKRFFPNEYLLSNRIDGMFSYDWIMTKREDVNYRECTFKDPNPPEFWETINEELAECNIKDVVEKLALDPTGLYCFQSDYAILGVPIKRIELTANAIKDLGLTTTINEQQKEHVITLLSDLPVVLKNQIII